jgi:hypothetical protein
MHSKTVAFYLNTLAQEVTMHVEKHVSFAFASLSMPRTISRVSTISHKQKGKEKK